MKKRAIWCLFAVAICLFGLSLLGLGKFGLGTFQSRAPSPVTIAAPHLNRAEESIAKATRTHFQAIDALFVRSRSQSPTFAKSALGWGSKWRIIADATPFTRGDRHAEYLKEQFEAQVLKGEDLSKAIEQAVNEFLAEIRNSESKMLVDLRVDVEDFKSTYELGRMDSAEVQSQFDAAVENAMLISGNDLQSNISSQLVSIVVGEVLTQVAIRLGVSAGILGTGAASGWFTLGVGVIVGLVIDQIVSAIWTHISDPQKNLEEELNIQLKVMQRLICFGDKDTKGLVQHFEEIAKSRAELRRVAVSKLLGAAPDSIPSTK
ncbi:MAG: hypothetical protein NTY15_07955 [Planctomycetota bacterium]|nr:hypothetical protein [Planctomycetota bacterium]